MEPLAPDWRTLGGSTTVPTAAAPAAPPTPAHRAIVITPRVLTWLVVGLLAAALAGGAVFLAMMPTGGGVVVETDTGSAGVPDASPATDGAGRPARLLPMPADLVVDVEGAVPHPGLVHVPAGGRVGDALTQAGGFGANADLTRTASELNLAEPVTDGLKVVVPAIGQATTDTRAATAAGAGTGTGAVGTGAGVAAAGSGTASGPVDLNRATEAELDALPGVGPATIAKIVAARQSAPFTTTEDLRTRKIVGDAVYQQLKGLVTVGR